MVAADLPALKKVESTKIKQTRLPYYTLEIEFLKKQKLSKSIRQEVTEKEKTVWLPTEFSLLMAKFLLYPLNYCLRRKVKCVFQQDFIKVMTDIQIWKKKTIYLRGFWGRMERDTSVKQGNRCGEGIMIDKQ